MRFLDILSMRVIFNEMQINFKHLSYWNLCENQYVRFNLLDMLEFMMLS